MLTIELELLTGAYRASLTDGSGAEWPPHPERVFSALVQAWGDGGRDAGERMALEWLEALAPPAIEACSLVSERTAPAVYVPPNDAKGGELEVLPDRRRRQARSFRVAVPESPLVRFRWSTSPDELKLQALRSLASRVASVGHSASLARLALREVATPPDPERQWRPAEDGNASLRTTYAGRLADLERWFADGGQDAKRPLSKNPVLYRTPSNAAEAKRAKPSVFGGRSDWFVFEDDGAGGFRPDLLAFAHVARTVRDALMSVGPQPSPEIVTGHSADGQPSSRPHLAVVPLANVGWGRERSSGDLLGFAVVLPREASVEARQAAVGALAKFVQYEEGRGICTLRFMKHRAWTLERSPSPSRASLRPDRWCRTACTWASATPVLLDRFPEGGDPAEEARLVAASCHHIGLPEPVEIEIHKHSALAGAPSAYPSRGQRRPDWTFPLGSKLSNRPRRHIVLRFEEPVKGPVLLGAGRYHGFGLFLPIEGE